MTTTSKSQPTKASAKVTDAPADSGARRVPTKSDQLLALLQTPDGVSIEELSQRFGWMQHTTRAALTGVRKKGHAVVRSKQGSVTVYRIDG
jgi:predicted ArsR family transcriptional regulator